MSKRMEKISLILFLLIVVLVFISSSMTYKQQTMVPTFSKHLSGKPFYGILRHIHILYDGTDESISNVGYYRFVEFLIRKVAHFSSYFIMGVFLWLTNFNKIKGYTFNFLYSWLSATGLAALDEFHQQLTGGRTPLIDDVMIDSCGALVGIILSMMLFYIIKKRKKLF